MTYNEWRESYHPGPLMNESMARAAWDTATIAEREACAQVCEASAYRLYGGKRRVNQVDLHTAEMLCRQESAIRERGNHE